MARPSVDGPALLTLTHRLDVKLTGRKQLQFLGAEPLDPIELAGTTITLGTRTMPLRQGFATVVDTRTDL